MEANSSAEIRTSDAYNRYKEWCVRNGYYAENATSFKVALNNVATIVRKRPKTGGEKTSLLIGYQLKPTSYKEDC